MELLIRKRSAGSSDARLESCYVERLPVPRIAWIMMKRVGIREIGVTTLDITFGPDLLHEIAQERLAALL